MKLYDGRAPNPWRVRIFLAEKGIEVPRQQLALLEGETRTEAFGQINPRHEVPVLELDDGTRIAESLAICRYLEEQHPEPPLFGADAVERALVEMWTRRVELHLFAAIGAIGLHELPFFATKIEQIPAYAATQRRRADAEWAWLDGQMADGRDWIAGQRFTVADITAMAALMVADLIGAPVPDTLPRAKAWEARARARPSWAA